MRYLIFGLLLCAATPAFAFDAGIQLGQDERAGAFVGFDVAKNLSIRASYAELRYGEETIPATCQVPAASTVNLYAQGLGADLRWSIPLGKLSVDLSAGAYRMRADQAGGAEDWTTKGRAAVGLSAAVNKDLRLFLEAESLLGERLLAGFSASF